MKHNRIKTTIRPNKNAPITLLTEYDSQHKTTYHVVALLHCTRDHSYIGLDTVSVNMNSNHAIATAIPVMDSLMLRYHRGDTILS